MTTELDAAIDEARALVTKLRAELEAAEEKAAHMRARLLERDSTSDSPVVRRGVKAIWQSSTVAMIESAARIADLRLRSAETDLRLLLDERRAADQQALTLRALDTAGRSLVTTRVAVCAAIFFNVATLAVTVWKLFHT